MARQFGLIVSIFVVLAAAEPAAAQLFGERTLGQPLTRRPGPGQQSSVSANARFVRGSATSNTFIGSDKADVRSFVGSEQGRTQGTATSAVATLREQAAPRVNRPRGRMPTNRPYAARLEPAFNVRADAPQSAVDRLQKRLASAFEDEKSRRFAVSLAGPIATVQGEVPSAADRELAELLMLLEPGIDTVRNQISVQPPSPPQPPEPSVPQPASSR